MLNLELPGVSLLLAVSLIGAFFFCVVIRDRNKERESEKETA